MRFNRCEILAALVGGLWAGLSSAQNYPNRPIHIHTTGAGGTVDFAARTLAPEISATLGQSVVVENKPNTSLATGVAKAAPDGYTLLIWGPGFWNGQLLTKVSYDVMRDFSFISTVTRSPNIVVVTASLPVKSVAELIELAKSRPGQLNYASGATGSSNHIGAELFKSMTGTNIVRVAYKGGAGEVPDLISGQVHLTIGGGATFVAHFETGKLRALATTGLQRSKLFPDLPTVAETVPGYVADTMFGMFAPAKTPIAAINRLNQETVRALGKPDVRERLQKVGQEASSGTPEQLKEAVQMEMARVSKLIKEGAIKPGE